MSFFNKKAVAVVGSGFSLKKEDIKSIQAAGLGIVAVNNTYELIDSADILYACDARWWREYRCRGAAGGHGNIDFKGKKISLEKTDFPDVELVENSGSWGFDNRFGFVKTGKNSGAQAVQVAYQHGARRIILLGMDCRYNPVAGRGSHFFGEHAWRRGKQTANYDEFLKGWGALAGSQPDDLDIVNCTPDSAIGWFRRGNLCDVLHRAI